MKNSAIFYYIGTGNSLCIAHAIAVVLGGAELIGVSTCWDEKNRPCCNHRIGLFVTYMGSAGYTVPENKQCRFFEVV